MKRLPKKLKSGRRLIATAAEGNVGLYCLGTPKDEKSNYRIRTRSGKISRGMMGSGGYPLAPNDLKWVWKAEKKSRKKERRKKMAATVIDPRAGRSAIMDKPKKKMHLSESLRCQECRRSVLKLSHSHTLSHPERGYVQTFCCKCRRMMGYKCVWKKQQRIEKALWEATKHGPVVIVGRREHAKASTIRGSTRTKTHKRRRKNNKSRRHHSRNGHGEATGSRRDSLRRRRGEN